MDPSAQDPPVALTVDDERVGWLVIDGPGKLNILTSELLSRLNDLLDEVEAGVTAGRIAVLAIRSGKEGTFIAGADVNEIAAVTDAKEGTAKAAMGQQIFQRIARLAVPSLAVVDGICLGGGTELILACTHRIASDRKETRIGLPEVQLGILPAFGGTTRLPRLIGLRAALDIILTGGALGSRSVRRQVGRSIGAPAPAV